MPVVGPDTLTPVPVPGEGLPDTTLPFPEPATTQSILGAGAGGYQLWRCWSRVRGKSGWKAMAAAGDDSQQAVAARLVKLHAAITFLTVFYEAVRQGAWPELPDPRTYDSNFTLIGWHDRVQATVAGNATRFLCHARGRRVYACATPVYGWVTGLMVPVPPFSTAGKGTINVPPGNFTRGII
jgi:hypothetical protein